MRLNAAAKGLGQDGPTKGERVVPLSKGISKRIIIFQSIKNSLPSSHVIVLSRISGSLCPPLFASFVASRAAGPIFEFARGRKGLGLNLQSEICNLKFEINLALLQPQGPQARSFSVAISEGIASRPFGPILKLRPWRDGPQAI